MRDDERKEIGMEKTAKGIKACAEWLQFCLSIGWCKDHLDELEALWWKYHDKNGKLL
jgi:hypothetical protein